MISRFRSVKPLKKKFQNSSSKMLSQNPSQILKAQFRASEEDENYRCLSTLNYGSFFDENRKQFGFLQVFNDETLAPQQTKTFSAENGQTIVLIPLVGTIDYSTDFGEQDYIETQEFQISQAAVFYIRNPYEKELVNYLQIRFDSTNHKSSPFKIAFDLTEKNKLFSLMETDTCKISIGTFDARNETSCQIKDNHGIFAFVIAGAFEFQNILLESRDALCIWESSEIELEALSENAIILLIETPLQ